MESESASHTSPTLLGRLSQDPADQQAWARFVDQYGPSIYHWCRQWHLQEADAQDVTQNVLARLAEKMRAFRYDPRRSFRGWLRTLTRHACSDFFDARRRQEPATGGDDALARLDSVEARADLTQRLEEAFDQELLEVAKQRVQQRVAAHTWEAFRLTALAGVPSAAVADRLHLSVARVYVARNQVQRMLAEEIRRLQG